MDIISSPKPAVSRSEYAAIAAKALHVPRAIATLTTDRLDTTTYYIDTQVGRQGTGKTQVEGRRERVYC